MKAKKRIKVKKGGITKNTKIAGAIAKHPEIVCIFMESGMHCIGCNAAGFETIEQGAKAHGMNDKQIKEIIDKVNKIIAQSSTKNTKSQKKIIKKHAGNKKYNNPQPLLTRNFLSNYEREARF